MDTRTAVWVSTAEEIFEILLGETRNLSRKFRGGLRASSQVRAATLQKCGSEIFLRFSLPKVSWNLAWNFGEMFRATFSRVWVCEGKFHPNFTAKTAWKTENFAQISLCWGAALKLCIKSRPLYKSIACVAGAAQQRSLFRSFQAHCQRRQHQSHQEQGPHGISTPAPKNLLKQKKPWPWQRPPLIKGVDVRTLNWGGKCPRPLVL